MSFSAVDSQTNSITFLNYLTRPSMPVWAAIIATSSLPFFFKPFPDQKEWNYYPESSHEDRLTKGYFSNDRNLSNYYQSADLLMKHPLELISNEKLKSIITREKEEIYLTLNFADEDYPYLGEVKEIVSQPLTTHDLTFKLDLPNDFFGLFASVPIISENLKILDLYMSSHDNLIMNIYKDELALLRIRLGTLDFAKMTNKEKTELSGISKDAITQARYILKEKMENRANQDKAIYFRVEKETHQGKRRIYVRFLSGFHTCQKFL